MQNYLAVYNNEISLQLLQQKIQLRKKYYQ